jgi:hypothetical protein
MSRYFSVAAVTLMALSTPGCIYVSTPPQRTVVQETRYIGPGQETVITTLPPNYRIRVYRGTTYYVHDNVLLSSSSRIRDSSASLVAPAAPLPAGRLVNRCVPSRSLFDESAI